MIGTTMVGIANCACRSSPRQACGDIFLQIRFIKAVSIIVSSQTTFHFRALGLIVLGVAVAAYGMQNGFHVEAALIVSIRAGPYAASVSDCATDEADLCSVLFG